MCYPHHLGAMNFFVHLIFLLICVADTFAAFSYDRMTPKVSEPQLRIVGGHEAIPHSHPYIVSLQLRFLWVRAHVCGGSLLNEYWVLTAGHCIIESWLLRWLPMDVVAGAHNVDYFNSETQVSPVDRRITHPLYNGGVGPNDIALLKVKTPFSFTKQVQPVNLPVNYKISPQPMTLSGWGVLRTTIFFPALPDKLQEVKVTYIPFNECYKALEEVKDEGEENPLDKDANICSGPLTGGIAACNGDSGGPLVQVITANEVDQNAAIDDITETGTANKIATNNGTVDEYDYEYTASETNEIERKVSNKPMDRLGETPVVVGVVSWGAMPCGEKGAPTVYTKVSNYLDFINQYINK